MQLTRAFARFWSVLSPLAPADSVTRLSPDELPSPWEIWAIFGLIRYHRRLIWLGDIAQTHLRGEHRPVSGHVPGSPEWEYRLLGSGCRLTHRVTGECLETACSDDPADHLSLPLYLQYLRSLRQPEAVEARLIVLNPTLESLTLEWDRFHAAGLLITVEGSISALPQAIVQQADTLQSFLEGWANRDHRPTLAQLIGDALESDLTSDRARQLRGRRIGQLRDHYERHLDSQTALLALIQAEPADVSEILTSVLRGPIWWTIATALEQIQKRDDFPDWRGELIRLFERLHPDGAAPHGNLWLETLRLLMRLDDQPERIATLLGRARGYLISDAAMLALETNPAIGRKLLREGVRSPLAVTRTQSAAILGLIDQPWSRHELTQVLEEIDDIDTTTAVLAALAESGHRETRDWLEEWESLHGNDFDPDEPLASSETQQRDAAIWMEQAMDLRREQIRGLSLAARSGGMDGE